MSDTKRFPIKSSRVAQLEKGTLRLDTLTDGLEAFLHSMADLEKAKPLFVRAFEDN